MQNIDALEEPFQYPQENTVLQDKHKEGQKKRQMHDVKYLFFPDHNLLTRKKTQILILQSCMFSTNISPCQVKSFLQ